MKNGENPSKSVETKSVMSTHPPGTLKESLLAESLPPTFHPAVAEGDWLCFAALWCHWVTMGTASALLACDVLVIQAEALLAVAAKSRIVWKLTEAYGQHYHARSVSAVPPHSDWPTDLLLLLLLHLIMENSNTQCSTLLGEGEARAVFRSPCGCS